MINGLFGMVSGGTENNSPTSIIDAHINDVSYGGTNNVPIQHGGSWWEDLLNTVVLTNKNYNESQASVEASRNQPQIINYPQPTPVGVVPSNQQGAAVGATVGSFADKAVNFAKQNWVILAAAGGAYFLYQSQPKSRR